MSFTWDNILANAIAFSKYWKNAGNEKAEAQTFVMDFLRVFGVADPMAVGGFEYKVSLSGARIGYIDYVWKGKIAIEMKSRGKDLNAAFSQLQTYMQHLPEEEIPDLWLVCDFENIRLCRRSTNEIWNFKTKDLRKHIKRFADIAGYETERVRDDQVEVNVKAAEKMAKLHDALKTHGYEGHDLEVYLVRLLFCLFADDTGIFPQDSFFRYIDQSRADGYDLSDRIARLFEVLNMPEDARAKRTLLADELRQFRYINGMLFSATLPMAEFDAKMRQTLIDCVNFDWSRISPAIFGAMFQGVMDKNQRRELGAHYTSEENILKLINPLFMDELWKEFDRVKTDPAALDRFHEKIAGLKFLDPACGCGNFLIITYRELRMLELEVLKMKIGAGQRVLDISPLLKVSVEQFYGIECEDFPCQIARVGMWLIDHQMNLRVSDQFGQYYARLPLTQSATIVHGNALRIDWENVVPKEELSYILGNPPFIGYAYQSSEQKEDIALLTKNKNLDYVAMWYIKAAQYIQNTQIRGAFVSTNSIVQGEQVTALWKPLSETLNIYINFGIPTFRWSNEAKGKAAVHCVIVGFSAQKTENDLNPYLVKATVVFLEKRSKPICDVPEMSRGNEPADGGNLLLNQDEYEELIAKEPLAEKYIKRFSMGEEFLHNIPRYCLWLVGAAPADLKKMPRIMERVEKVRQMRLTSKRARTLELAQTPTLFERTKNPCRFLALPKVSSERRKYIPIAYLDGNTIVGDKLFFVPDATLYHFGILTSAVHMAWMRVVCGRLEMRYSYSSTIVYNNFPWPDVIDEQKAIIEKLTQEVLDARALFPDNSLADLYDPLIMPQELLNAHKELDRAVMKLYGFSKDTTEPAIVAALMERYRELAGGLS